jgi:hypothetical protein
LNLRLAELGLLPGNPKITAQRQLAATTEGVARDRRNGRLGNASHRRERSLQGIGAGNHVLVRGLRHLLDISTSGEHLRTAVEDNSAHIVTLRRLDGGLPDLLLDLK